MAKATLLAGFTGPRPSWQSEADLNEWKATFLKNGFAAPTCWYKVMTDHIQPAEDARKFDSFLVRSHGSTDRWVVIPDELAFPPKTAPLFFAGALQDYLCLAEEGHQTMQIPQLKDHDVTIRDFDSDHWLILSKAEEVCLELESWIQGTVIPKAGL